ncbi:hypothetical protein FQS87_15740 [Enterococcus avium]|uniref:hypothetical protein n=1 Tax=Enterococcus TaxID=1350 RepID=UPI001A96740C|nr:hypothetical protein [Enterococcus avium]MBO1141359.1 hypothetical protein [Enterococcus avium]
MLNQNRKVSHTIMIVSYVLFVLGLFLWDWGAILFISVFTFGIPLIGLVLPVVGIGMDHAKSYPSLYLRLFCSLIITIPLFITISSLPLETLVDESGAYIATPNGQVLAILIIVSGVFYLVNAFVMFRNQYQVLKERNSNPKE